MSHCTVRKCLMSQKKITRRTSPFDFVQLRLQTLYFCHLSRPSLVHHEMHSPSQRCISSGQMTDKIFEIETTALAHVACAPQESGVLLTDFAAACPIVNPSWIFSVIENSLDSLPFSVVSCEVFTGTASHTWNSREHGKAVPRVGSFLQWHLTRSSDGSKSQLSQGTPTTWSLCNLHNALTLTISLLHHSLFEV